MKNNQDRKPSFTESVTSLINKMSLQQKLGQLQSVMTGPGISDHILKRYFGGIGQLTISANSWKCEEYAAFVDKLQRSIIEKCGIPALIHSEALTGFIAADASGFPSSIGLGATWNPETAEKMADIIRKQMVAVGVRHALSPVMDVARDPRWGRIGETYGEDPTLCAAMSVAYIKGLQSGQLENGVLATGKHFIGYGFSEGGLNMTSNPIPPRELREVHAKPYQAAISEGHLTSVMSSYGSVDGELVIQSKHILTNLLREEMGLTVWSYRIMIQPKKPWISGFPNMRLPQG
jgi:beta-glucosidase